MQVVWFKRDLRVFDHEPLSMASKQGQVLPLYILEPELWKEPDLSYRHYAYLKGCLKDLSSQLQDLGQGLVIKVGDALEIMQQLREKYGSIELWSHQETWNDWTYQRDLKLKIWTKANKITWHECQLNGIIRGLKHRDGWSKKWQQHMQSAPHGTPQKLKTLKENSDKLPTYKSLGLEDSGPKKFQASGREQGLKILHDFLYVNGESYSKEMSSPLTAYKSCSRLSTHLAFGSLSMREIYQALESRRAELRTLDKTQRGNWLGSLQAFSGRLHWHCHFIQKLEDEPSSEYKNLHSAYQGLREDSFNQTYFEAWKNGKTGYPMVDACMRALIATGWINFRMRAMLMSFSSYHLWLHWREPALYLARLFSDYEPGIHYSQTQMQSGTTGINTVRIYNPTKQGLDHDPDGVFIRKWVPELKSMPTESIHTPWVKPELLNGYPLPIVDEKEARDYARQQFSYIRRSTHHKDESSEIVEKHGSRKKPKTKMTS